MIAARVEAVRARIEAAARRSGRSGAAVTLVAAAKAVGVERLEEARAAGIRDFGENRAQDLVAKAPALGEPARWHFIGRLQRNKVRAVASFVRCWQTVDRAELAAAIARHAPGAHVLVQVNLAGEPQKGGCPPAAAGELVDAARDLGLRVGGLMTVPPQHGEPRRWFSALRDLGSRLGLRELSMGMSDDYEAAVEEGATIVRLGRALFGDRPPPPVGTASVT